MKPIYVSVCLERDSGADLKQSDQTASCRSTEAGSAISSVNLTDLMEAPHQHQHPPTPPTPIMLF